MKEQIVRLLRKKDFARGLSRWLFLHMRPRNVYCFNETSIFIHRQNESLVFVSIPVFSSSRLIPVSFFFFQPFCPRWFYTAHTRGLILAIFSKPGSLIRLSRVALLYTSRSSLLCRWIDFLATRFENTRLSRWRRRKRDDATRRGNGRARITGIFLKLSRTCEVRMKFWQQWKWRSYMPP